MSPTSEPLLPAATWLVAAALCLLLEAAGTPVGARKRGARPHLPWVIGLAGVAVVVENALRWSAMATDTRVAGGLVLDRTGLVVTALIGVLVAVCHAAAAPALREMDEERGEMSACWAVFGAAMSLLCVAADLLAVGAALVLAVASMSLLAAPDRDGAHGIEAAAKVVVGLGVVGAFLAIAVVLSWTSTDGSTFAGLQQGLEASAPGALQAVGVVLVALTLLLGAVPLHQATVDLAHGASPSAAAAFSGAVILAVGTVLARLADRTEGHVGLSSACAGVALLTLIGAPVAALDQARVARAAAYLTVLPGALLFAAAASDFAQPSVDASGAMLQALVTGAWAATAAILGVAVPAMDPSSTWEDWAGFGRKRPVVAALLVYALGSLAGVPGTMGFTARLDVAQVAFAAGLDALGLAVVSSAAVGAAPIVRLALFLFAKEPPPRPARPASFEVPLQLLVFVGFVAVMVALVLWPSLLDALVALPSR